MHVFTVGSLIHSDESRAVRTRNADDKYTEYNACTVFVVGRRSNRSSDIGRTRWRQLNVSNRMSLRKSDMLSFK